MYLTYIRACKMAASTTTMNTPITIGLKKGDVIRDPVVLSSDQLHIVSYTTRDVYGTIQVYLTRVCDNTRMMPTRITFTHGIVLVDLPPISNLAAPAAPATAAAAVRRRSAAAAAAATATRCAQRSSGVVKVRTAAKATTATGPPHRTPPGLRPILINGLQKYHKSFVAPEEIFEKLTKSAAFRDRSGDYEAVILDDHNHPSHKCCMVKCLRCCAYMSPVNTSQVIKRHDSNH